jgi:hypothetical protein
MDRETYNHLNQAEIDRAVEQLIPDGAGVVTDLRLRAALKVLVGSVASNTRAYELLGIKASEELAEEWGVSRRRTQKFIADLHERWGVGRKIGNVWCLSAAEAETHRPAQTGRPKKATKKEGA